MASYRGRPFELPRFGVAQEVDLRQAALIGVADGEVGEQLERGARRVFRVIAGLEEKQRALKARTVRHGDSLAADSEKQQLQPPCFRAAVDQVRIELVDGWFTRDRCARRLLPP